MKKLLILSLLFILRICFVFGEAKVCVLPFISNSEELEKEYFLTDGIARLFVNELNYTKRMNAVDYDIMVAYLYESYIDTDYKTLATNTTLAIEMLSNVFNPDYIITGSVETFSSSTNKNKEKANVAYEINIIDVKNKETVASMNVSSFGEAFSKGFIVKTHDAYFSETSLGIATSKALSDAANKIVINLNYPSLKALVVRVEGDFIYINAGKTNNVLEGDLLNLYKSKIELGESESAIITETTENAEDGKKQVIRYKSDMLRRYLNAKEKLTYVGKCRIKTVYENYALAERYVKEGETSLFTPELLMVAMGSDENAKKSSNKNRKIKN